MVKESKRETCFPHSAKNYTGNKKYLRTNKNFYFVLTVVKSLSNLEGIILVTYLLFKHCRLKETCKSH